MHGLDVWIVSLVLISACLISDIVNVLLLLSVKLSGLEVVLSFDEDVYLQVMFGRQGKYTKGNI